ncbi:MAG: prepilin-type N-terminal cleavage/methylation domain-containing protein [Gammaproteobacteria bacterium]|nr:prepilin-type N-terminal cleavage/methylation domain-containing protein [Gammaproteobacteria bacterium]
MRGSQGFSLIELLLVTLIIGILATIAIPRLTAARDRAFVATMQADLRNLATQQEIHYADELTYSDDLDDLEFSASERVTVDVEEATGTGWSATATHEAFDDDDDGCSVYYGDAEAPELAAPDEAGVIACTR